MSDRVEPWVGMWALAFAVYCGCKALTWLRTPHPPAPLWRHLSYLLAWPGLDVAAFFNLAPLPEARRPTLHEWTFAAVKFAFGVVVLVIVATWGPANSPYLLGWVGMIGLAFVLHFGVFHLLSCGWRSIGVDAAPLMDWPILSQSVSEFWGKRWNRAFRDLTHRFLFRPLAARLGPRWALLAGFVFSGLVHDAVISLPAGGGYGGPTVFFAIQGAAMFVERGALGKALGLGGGWRGRVFTAVVILGPAGLLFHPPFVERIVVPMIEALGGVL